MEAFRIKLNSATNIFLATEAVTGVVVLRTSEPVKARKLELKIIGRAKTAFWHPRIQNLWESPDESNKLPPGNYEYPFSFVIPENAPANRMGNYGTIRYYVKATLNIPWGLDKSVYDGFTVCPYIDLNLDTKLAMPVISAVQKTSLFSSKAVNLSISMPKMGYVCGESIPLRVEINNESSSEVTSIESGIRANYIFIGSHQTVVLPLDTQKRESSCSYSVVKDPLPLATRESHVYERAIPIPPLPPSLSHCPNITLRYHVFVKVHTSAVFSRSASANMPIVIGTVPIQQTMANAAPTVIGFEAHLPAPAPSVPPPDYTLDSLCFSDIEVSIPEGGNQEEQKLIPDDDDDDGPDYLPKFPYFPKLSHK